jgi:hypothetical protein
VAQAEAGEDGVGSIGMSVYSQAFKAILQHQREADRRARYRRAFTRKFKPIKRRAK